MTTEKNQIEEYFEWWLNELSQNGFIKHYEREKTTFVVREPAKYGKYKRYKSKEKTVQEFNLFPKIKYTSDYTIEWTEKAEYYFYEEINPAKVFQFGKPIFIAHRSIEEEDGVPIEKILSYVDVKPTNAVARAGGRVSSSVTFPLKNRMLWEEHGIFVNKVVPIPMAKAGYNSALFIESFTPTRYLFTDGGKQKRKIKFNVVTLKQYVAQKKKELETILKTTV